LAADVVMKEKLLAEEHIEKNDTMTRSDVTSFFLSRDQKKKKNLHPQIYEGKRLFSCSFV
jgi:hypothetical protein